jgi:murein L,D-transpeptidase YafK
MFLREGEVFYNEGQYLTANRKITEAEYLLTSVYSSATEELKTYFKSYPEWKKWVQSAINDSRRNNSYSIIVDKFSRKCYLYLGGVKKYEFDAELGRNWVGDKQKSGDKATPEGFYKIVRKYQGRETPYHKALALNYPNEEDKESFKKSVAKGILPESARIGGGIEIHGGGGKGVDWTEGCIALTNSGIDLVYNLVKVGTPVTIVGSVKPIDEILVN